jgi:hypothetical protein
MNHTKHLISELEKLMEDSECNGMYCSHERSDKHYVIGEEDLLWLVQKLISKHLHHNEDEK